VPKYRRNPLSSRANAIVTIAQLLLQPPKEAMAKAAVMTYKPPKRQIDGDLAVSQEKRLFGLLRRAEGYAYSLAHSYDIGGWPDRAYVLVALGERLRDTAMDVSDLDRPVEPHSATPVLSLRSRAFSLRRLLRGTAWPRQNVAPMTLRPSDEQHLTGPTVGHMTTITSSDSEKAVDSSLAPTC
jgi:hypothetical protein